MLQLFITLLAQPRERDETGASAVEYGLLVAGVAIAVLAAVAGLTGIFNSAFAEISGAIAGDG